MTNLNYSQLSGCEIGCSHPNVQVGIQHSAVNTCILHDRTNRSHMIRCNFVMPTGTSKERKGIGDRGPRYNVFPAQYHNVASQTHFLYYPGPLKPRSVQKCNQSKPHM